MRNRLATHDEGAREVDTHDAVPVLDLQLVGIVPPHDAGNVAENMRGAEASDHLTDDRAHRDSVADVAKGSLRYTPAGADGGNGFVQAALLNVDHQRRARPRLPDARLSLCRASTPRR